MFIPTQLLKLALKLDHAGVCIRIMHEQCMKMHKKCINNNAKHASLFCKGNAWELQPPKMPARCNSSNSCCHRAGMLDMQVRDLLDAGVNVGIGVDGTASNDTGHVLMELRMAMLLQRAGGNPKGKPHRQSKR